MYSELIDDSRIAGKIININVALSREGEKQYVSHLVLRDANFVANVLTKGGVLMLCGSLAMQKDVMKLLESICLTKTGKSISYYQSHNQIRTDCY